MSQKDDPRYRKYYQWSGYEREGAENLSKIDENTSNADLADAIEVNAASLNHEDEYAIPAYTEAVKRLRALG